MTVAFLFVMPIGFMQALDAFGAPLLILAGIGVGICSSVIPYVCDQLAMSRLPRSSFAFLLALLPATATIVGVIVLRQIPSALDVVGVLLVMIGVAVHNPHRSRCQKPSPHDPIRRGSRFTTSRRGP
jgi:inner membrane transporter RhtA